jgi:Ca2+-binding RTX toxin-like protein
MADRSDELYGLTGADYLYGEFGVDLLYGGADNDHLYGGRHGGDTGDHASDFLYGATGDDFLDGGSDHNPDHMEGGRDDDTYVVNDFFDVVVEHPDEGHDRFYSSSSYILPDNVEDLALGGYYLENLHGHLFGYGNGLDNLITGTTGINDLQGGGGSDRLFGYAGNDTLQGGSGADEMHGGEGDDTYYVDHAGIGSLRTRGWTPTASALPSTICCRPTSRI